MTEKSKKQYKPCKNEEKPYDGSTEKKMVVIEISQLPETDQKKLDEVGIKLKKGKYISIKVANKKYKFTQIF